jgi:hypothetical protein
MPPAIVKWCPAPIIIGNPGVAIFGHFPVAICIIGPEFFLIYIRTPYLSVLRVIYPYSIGRQFLIKGFQRDVLILSLYLYG